MIFKLRLTHRKLIRCLTEKSMSENKICEANNVLLKIRNEKKANMDEQEAKGSHFSGVMIFNSVSKTKSIFRSRMH